MSEPIRRAAVLGAGVMGSGIAAHLANAGIEVLLLDIVPPGLSADEARSRAARNRFARGGLDKALKIIRASDGKQDAAQKLMRAFPLDEAQTTAILELQLYRISQLEIGRIREELEEKLA